MEGNLNYFGGGPECKKPTSWEHPRCDESRAWPLKVLDQGLASYSNIARGRAYPVLYPGSTRTGG